MFQFVGIDWAPLEQVEAMLIIFFKGFGGLPRGRNLWRVANLTLIWTTWQERSARIFKDRQRFRETSKNLFYFSSSLWASTNEGFLSFILLDWNLVCKTIRLTKETLFQ